MAALTLPRTRRVVQTLFSRQLWLVVAAWWAAQLLTLTIYASLRGKMDDVGFPVHGSGLETGVFGSLPTLWLQHNVYTIAPHQFEWGAVIVHGSWFFVPVLAAIFVTWRRPRRIGSMFRWWIALQALALVLFALLPVRPPWLANSEVIRIVALRFGGEIDDPNALAAMPSLHVAFPLLISVWFVKEKWKLPAIAMSGYTALIAFEVVFSGEHYVVDVVGSCLTVAAITVLARTNFAAVWRRTEMIWRAISGRFARLRVSEGGQSGQTIIEFTLALPIILLFLLVMVDFGMALDHRLVMQHAVSEGVREAAVSKLPSDAIATTVDQSQGLVAPGDVTVCYIDLNSNGTVGDPGDKVRVSATYDYEFTAGGGDMLRAFGVTPPTITMKPVYTTAVQTNVTGATACS